MVNEEVVRSHMAAILTEGLGLDLDDPNLSDTPKRIAKMYCRELFGGLHKEFGGYTLFPNEGTEHIVLLDNVFFVSMCSHHFLPFTGLCWLAYLPDKYLIGASKPARLVNHYASRPQLQERLAQDVLDNFVKHVRPKGAMILMRAVHGCMKCRGVRQQHSGMMDSALYGIFKSDQKARTEVLDLIKISLMEMKL